MPWSDTLQQITKLAEKLESMETNDLQAMTTLLDSLSKMNNWRGCFYGATLSAIRTLFTERSIPLPNGSAPPKGDTQC
jgi:hypothetical protein